MPILVGPVGRGVDRNHPGRADIVRGVEDQHLHASRSAREDAEIDAARTDRRSQRRAPSPAVRIVLQGVRSAYALPNWAFAATTTRSGSKPNFLCSSFSGAEAPNVFIPITWPDVPTYRSHPNVEACSIATPAFRPGGSTLSRYSCVGGSKMSHERTETTRERMSSASSLPWASTARLSSLPEAMRMTSGLRPGGSAST